jgi:hypothetical protein
MSSIINRFLGKKSVRNEELLALADRLSFRNSQLDSFLIGHFIQRDKTDPVDYFAFQEQLLKLHVDRFEAIQVELNLLNQYLQLAERFLPAGFSVKWENKLQFQDEIMLPPLILFPEKHNLLMNSNSNTSRITLTIQL